MVKLIFICSMFFASICCSLNTSFDVCANECGLSSSYFAKERSYGGYASEISRAPFVVFLRAKMRECNFEQHCTGVIIDATHILTAQHCLEVQFPLENECSHETGPIITSLVEQNITHIYNFRTSEITIFTGMTDPNQINEHEGLKLKKMSIISRKNQNSLNNLKYTDVAILELKRKLKFSENIRKICLPDEFIESFGDMVYYSGYGLTNEKFDRPPSPGDKLMFGNLQTINLELSSQDLCKSSDGSNNTGEYLCAGTASTGIETGDSGGALYTFSKGRAFLIGIAAASSSGNKDLKLNEKLLSKNFKPDTYTKVSSICKWIEKFTTVKCQKMGIEVKKECADRAFKIIKNKNERKIIEDKNNNEEGKLVSNNEIKPSKSWWEEFWG